VSTIIENFASSNHDQAHTHRVMPKTFIDVPSAIEEKCTESNVTF